MPVHQLPPSSCDIIIITALRSEYLAVRQHLANVARLPPHHGTIYELGEFDNFRERIRVAILEIGMDNPTAAQETERALNYLDPSYAFLVGVAGGIASKGVKLGDVVVGTKIYAYETGKADAAFQPRPLVYQTSYPLQQLARIEARGDKWLNRLNAGCNEQAPKVFLAPIASGEKVVSSTRSAVYDLIQTVYNDTHAVEMESAGFLRSVYANQGTQATIVRGISDLIDWKTEADAKGYQEIASQSASAFAFHLVANLAIERKPGRLRPLNLSIDKPKDTWS